MGSGRRGEGEEGGEGGREKGGRGDGSVLVALVQVGRGAPVR